VFVGGIALGLWRHRLTVDRRRRQWRKERGFWPRVAETQGDLDDGGRIVLRRKRVRAQNAGASNHYYVLLQLDAGPDIGIGAATAQVLGRRLMVEMARRLELPALDETGAPSQLVPWKDLEMPPDPFSR